MIIYYHYLESMVRVTKQRKTIHNVLVKYGRPLSVKEILELARSEVAGLGIATVYRSLKALQEEGQAIPVNLPGQSPRWEITPEGHHHHFLCNTCDKLFEIHGCPQGMAKLLPKGYHLEEHDILLRGQCDTCTQRANSSRSNTHRSR
ncbi:MAG: transcriptional repressor [Dehalococcoidia bacterium]|jgi:Fur family ferric uptake transcriptional regulator